MDQEKEIYTRTDIIQQLGIQSYILSAWEKEFAVATTIDANNQQLYTFQGYTQLKRIKELIYEKGHNLDTAKKIIAENKTEPTLAASHLHFTPKKEPKKQPIDPTFITSLKDFQKQLIKLRELLN